MCVEIQAAGVVRTSDLLATRKAACAGCVSCVPVVKYGLFLAIFYTFLSIMVYAVVIPFSVA